MHAAVLPQSDDIRSGIAIAEMAIISAMKAAIEMVTRILQRFFEKRNGTDIF